MLVLTFFGLEGGSVTNSQLFNFASGSTSIPLMPQNGNNATCLVNSNGALSPADCDDSADQVRAFRLFNLNTTMGRES